ncbi:hypothetical protein TNCV_1842151 [Trichonephila clavipes]|nr:hypothetical protein TNCV_1842151 [Trichonephila clavipes]
MRSVHCRDIISAAENDPNFLSSLFQVMKPGVSNMILKQSDKGRNGSQKIHHKPKKEEKFHPKSNNADVILR